MRTIKLLALLGAMAFVIPSEAQIKLKRKSEGESEEKTEVKENKGKLGAKIKGFNPLKAVGKLAGNLMTQSTDNLQEVSLTAYYMDNLFPSDAGVVETEYFGFWEEGTSAAGVFFTKKNGIGFYKIDGSVTINGSGMDHVANGFYGGIVDGGRANHTFDVSTESGQTASFKVDQMGPIEILSINGQSKTDAITIDKNNDLVLELKSNDPNAQGFFVSIVGKVLGVTQFNEIGSFFSVRDKITIPKEAFDNTAVPGLEFQEGDNYLLVTQVKEDVQDLSGIGAARLVSSSMDFAKITFKGQPEKKVLGIPYEAGALHKDEVNGIKSEVSKPSAFTGVPFQEAKKVAIGSFVLRATKLKQQRVDVSSSSYTAGNMKVTTTTTTTETRTFPKVKDEFWDQMVEEFYKEFEAELKSKLNVEIVPIEEVLKAPSYQKMQIVEDTVTEAVVVKPYKNSKVLLPTTLSEIVNALGTTFPSDKAEVRILNELGVDAIIAVTVDCEMAWEDGALSPRMSFRMTGGTNGWKVGPTIYAQGLINGPGVGIKESKDGATDIVDQLKKIMRVQDVIDQFGASLSGLKAEEAKLGYEKIWDLR